MTDALTIRKSAIEGEVLPPSTPLPRYRTWNLDAAKMRAGFTRAPENCIHHRRNYYSGKWQCSDCGERLGCE